MKNIILMISGRGSNMLAIEQNVKSGNLYGICKIQTVFSNIKNAAGLQMAEDLGISTHVIISKGQKRRTYNNKLLAWLKQENPDYIVLAGYMKILSPVIIREFPGKIINVHPADTTQHQGLHGYNWAWENKLEETKVTVHYVDEGLDTGEIIGQKMVDLNGCRSLKEVEERGLKIEHKFYSECLLKVFSN